MADQEPPPAAAVCAAALDTFHDAAADDQLARRLSVVGASVAFRVRDDAALDFGVRLKDGAVVVLEHEDTQAEIRITLDARDLHELFAGGLLLPMKIARGQVEYEGPVRRFLRVVAILANQRERYAAHLVAARAEGGLG